MDETLQKRCEHAMRFSGLPTFVLEGVHQLWLPSVSVFAAFRQSVSFQIIWRLLFHAIWRVMRRRNAQTGGTCGYQGVTT